jgi:hypothetical protein
VKRNKNTRKIVSALSALLISTLPDTGAMEGGEKKASSALPRNNYKTILREIEALTSRIHTEVDKVLADYRRDTAEYHRRMKVKGETTTAIPEVKKVEEAKKNTRGSKKRHYQDTVKNTRWPFKPWMSKKCNDYLEKFKDSSYIYEFTDKEYPKISKVNFVSQLESNKTRIKAAKGEARTIPPTLEQKHRWGKLKDSRGEEVSYKTIANVVINHQGNILISKDLDRYSKIKKILKNTIIYEKPENVKVDKNLKPAEIKIVSGDLISQAIEQHTNGAKEIGIVVASDSANVGGGHTDGAGAMEEQLIFSIPYLSPVLGIVAEGHGYPLPENGAMIVKGAQIMRSPRAYAYLTPAEMFPITLIFSTAPDLRRVGNIDKFVEQNKYKENLEDKLAIQIMSAAAAGCKTLLLGAWGCGVFKNKPEDVAKAYVKILKSYQGHFEKIIVVIFNGEKDQNWIPFYNAFSQLKQ